MDIRIPLLTLMILLESSPLKSIISVRRLAVIHGQPNDRGLLVLEGLWAPCSQSGPILLPWMRGWRNTVETVLFEISNSMKPYVSVFLSYTNIMRLMMFLFLPNKLDELSNRIRQPLNESSPHCRCDAVVCQYSIAAPRPCLAKTFTTLWNNNVGFRFDVLML